MGPDQRVLVLGAFIEITLADAREAAIEAVKLARKGIDPIEQRKRDKAANLAAERAKQPITFREAAEAYCELHAPSWKHKYAGRVWLNPIIKYAYPVIGDFPLNDIEPRHIIAIRSAANKGTVPEPGQKSRGSKGPAPEAGQRVQRRIRKILSAAIVTGERDRARGNPADAELIAAVLPSKRKGERPHFRRIALDDAPEAFRALCEARKGAQGFLATSLDGWLFMITCAARPSEALHARWSEIDRGKRIWTVPPARMKAQREHIAPLPSRLRCSNGGRSCAPATWCFRGGRAVRSATAISPKRRRSSASISRRRIRGEAFSGIGATASVASAVTWLRRRWRIRWARSRAPTAGTRQLRPEARRWRPIAAGSTATPGPTSSPSRKRRVRP